MNRWRLLIVAVSAVAALAVGLGAQAGQKVSDKDIAALLPFEIGR